MINILVSIALMALFKAAFLHIFALRRTDGITEGDAVMPKFHSADGVGRS